MKTVFITGGTRGIGKGLVEGYCKAGYKVLFCYKNSTEKATELEQKLTNLGYQVKGYQLDISSYYDVEKFFTKLFESEKIDVLVNNAGICLPQKMLIDTTIEEWENLFKTNVTGVFAVTKMVAKQMMFRGGNIINISSMWGNVGGSCEACYSSSKGAINSLTLALAKELSSANIKVNCISLGVMDTDMNRHLTKEDMEELKQNTPLGRIGKPEDIVDVALLLSKEDIFITGQIITVDGGFTL